MRRCFGRDLPHDPSRRRPRNAHVKCLAANHDIHQLEISQFLWKRRRELRYQTVLLDPQTGYAVQERLDESTGLSCPAFRATAGFVKSARSGAPDWTKRGVRSSLLPGVAWLADCVASPETSKGDQSIKPNKGRQVNPAASTLTRGNWGSVLRLRCRSACCLAIGILRGVTERRRPASS